LVERAVPTFLHDCLRRRVGRVVLLTFRYGGLRLSELANLRTEEVDLDARRISLVGKDRKPRVIPIPHLLTAAVREYLEEIRPTLPASPFPVRQPDQPYTQRSP
jgi:integrase